MLFLFYYPFAYAVLAEPAPVLPTVDDYSVLVTPRHRNKFRYKQTVEAAVQPWTDLLAFFADVPRQFDLDVAVGAQLDVDGQWLGRSRQITFQLPSTYFSYDDPARGWDVGVWYEPNNPLQTINNMVGLEDEDYRRLLRAKVRANHWDGSIAQMALAYGEYFDNKGCRVFVTDNQNMGISVCVAGSVPGLVDLSVLDANYIPLQPAGVAVEFCIVSTYTPSPLFGFDVDNEYIGGWDEGAWSVSPDYLLNNTII